VANSKASANPSRRQSHESSAYRTTRNRRSPRAREIPEAPVAPNGGSHVAVASARAGGRPSRDRGALRDSAGVSDVPPVVGRHARAPRTASGSTAGHGCTVRKGTFDRRNARSFARHQAGAPEANSEKVAAARASTILHTHQCCAFTRMLEQQPEGSERELRAFVYEGSGDRAWSGPVTSNFGPGPALRWCAGSGPRSRPWQQRPVPQVGVQPVPFDARLSARSSSSS
jgi:hypothetical protein